MERINIHFKITCIILSVLPLLFFFSCKEQHAKQTQEQDLKKQTEQPDHFHDQAEGIRFIMKYNRR